MSSPRIKPRHQPRSLPAPSVPANIVRRGPTLIAGRTSGSGTVRVWSPGRIAHWARLPLNLILYGIVYIAATGLLLRIFWSIDRFILFIWTFFFMVGAWKEVLPLFKFPVIVTDTNGIAVTCGTGAGAALWSDVERLFVSEGYREGEPLVTAHLPPVGWMVYLSQLLSRSPGARQLTIVAGDTCIGIEAGSFPWHRRMELLHLILEHTGLVECPRFPRSYERPAAELPPGPPQPAPAAPPTPY